MRDMDYSVLLKIASEAAVKAGHFLLRSSKVDRSVHFESKHDVKIKADKQSEKIIWDILEKQSGLPILSEETSLPVTSSAPLRWIVDPIDGTLNFQRQIPLCCISIGLWRGADPVLGVIYDFFRSELFSSIVSQGAWLNSSPIRVSWTTTKEKAILFSGFPAGADLSSGQLSSMLKAIQSYRKVRWIGSAALSLAYVACGRADAYHERDIMFWDVTGGIPIVLGAGGNCLYQKNKQAHSYDVFAANESLFFSQRNTVKRKTAFPAA